MFEPLFSRHKHKNKYLCRIRLIIFTKGCYNNSCFSSIFLFYLGLHSNFIYTALVQINSYHPSWKWSSNPPLHSIFRSVLVWPCSSFFSSGIRLVHIFLSDLSFNSRYQVHVWDPGHQCARLKVQHPTFFHKYLAKYDRNRTDKYCTYVWQKLKSNTKTGFKHVVCEISSCSLGTALHFHKRCVTSCQGIPSCETSKFLLDNVAVYCFLLISGKGICDGNNKLNWSASHGSVGIQPRGE